MNESQGFLRIWVTAAGGTLPLSGVPVQVFDEDGTLLHVLRSGESGLTTTVTLPAPPASESLTPGTKPYATYRVSVDAPGYTPISAFSVPIFDGITSLQPIALVPVTGMVQGNEIAEDSTILPEDMAPPYLVHGKAQPEENTEMLYDDIDAPWYGRDTE